MLGPKSTPGEVFSGVTNWLDGVSSSAPGALAGLSAIPQREKKRRRYFDPNLYRALNPARPGPFNQSPPPPPPPPPPPVVPPGFDQPGAPPIVWNGTNWEQPPPPPPSLPPPPPPHNWGPGGPPQTPGSGGGPPGGIEIEGGPGGPIIFIPGSIPAIGTGGGAQGGGPPPHAQLSGGKRRPYTGAPIHSAPRRPPHNFAPNSSMPGAMPGGSAGGPSPGGPPSSIGLGRIIAPPTPALIIPAPMHPRGTVESVNLNTADNARRRAATGCRGFEDRFLNGMIEAPWGTRPSAAAWSEASQHIRATTLISGYAGLHLDCNTADVSAIVSANFNAFGQIGVYVRGAWTGSDFSGYWFGFDAQFLAEMALWRIDAGSPVELASFGSPGPDSDVWELRAVGGALSVWLNDVQQGLDVPDATYATGGTGLLSFDDDASVYYTYFMHAHR